MTSIRDFTRMVEAENQAIFVGAVADVKTSIVEGSIITGAPGQPVDTGNLRASWQVEFESPTAAIIGTNVAYAESNEDGIARPGGGPYRLLSKVGGRHSVAKTIQNFDAIVEDVTKKLQGPG